MKSEVASSQPDLTTCMDENASALRPWSTPHLMRLNQAADATGAVLNNKPLAHDELTITFMGTRFGHGPS